MQTDEFAHLHYARNHGDVYCSCDSPSGAQQRRRDIIPAHLYSYGLYSYGLYRYGLYSYGLYSSNAVTLFLLTGLVPTYAIVKAGSGVGRSL